MSTSRGPMSVWDVFDMSPEDFKTEMESDNTGGKVAVTRYKDGSSKYHFGGPCGPMTFDKNGEEC
jgi:hypothetical protein